MRFCSIFLLAFFLATALLSPSIATPVLGSDIDPYEDTRSSFNREYALYERERPLSSHPLNPHVLTTQRNILKAHFLSLSRYTSPPASSTFSPPPKSFTSSLSSVNQIRRNPDFIADADADPGSHLPLGTAWSYRNHGPYPASRLVQLRKQVEGSTKGLAENRQMVKTELENARNALDHQTLWESSTLGKEMVYTDQLRLLRAGVEYWQLRLSSWGEGAKEGLREVM